MNLGNVTRLLNKMAPRLATVSIIYNYVWHHSWLIRANKRMSHNSSTPMRYCAAHPIMLLARSKIGYLMLTVPRLFTMSIFHSSVVHITDLVASVVARGFVGCAAQHSKVSRYNVPRRAAKNLNRQ